MATDGEERDFLNEALRMLEEPPATMMLPTRAHLRALHDAYESQKIVLMRDLHMLIQKIGDMP